jgi:hypothetical protein
MLSRPETTEMDLDPQLQDVVISMGSLLERPEREQRKRLQRQISSGASNGFLYLVMLLLLATAVSVCQDAIRLALDSEHPCITVLVKHGPPRAFVREHVNALAKLALAHAFRAPLCLFWVHILVCFHVLRIHIGRGPPMLTRVCVCVCVCTLQG